MEYKQEIEVLRRQNGELIRSRIEALQERDQLRARVAELEVMIKYAQVSSGVCCCGDSMDNHQDAFDAGHSPVDQWDYAVANTLNRQPTASNRRGIDGTDY